MRVSTKVSPHTQTITYEGGFIAHYRYGVLHNEGAPAVEGPNYEAWYTNGQLDRYEGGTGLTFRRDGGPALIDGDRKEWRWHGKLHRTEGPAVVMGNDYKEWWIEGRKVRVQVEGVIYDVP